VQLLQHDMLTRTLCCILQPQRIVSSECAIIVVRDGNCGVVVLYMHASTCPATHFACACACMAHQNAMCSGAS
jgi:hypothetical protein